jgi:hypothetical protein
MFGSEVEKPNSKVHVLNLGLVAICALGYLWLVGFPGTDLIRSFNDIIIYILLLGVNWIPAATVGYICSLSARLGKLWGVATSLTLVGTIMLFVVLSFAIGPNFGSHSFTFYL